MKLPADSILEQNGDIFLKGINLEDSWLVGLTYNESESRLLIQLEFSIWPESEFYTAPKPDEWTCYRKGQINFNSVTEINGLIDLTNHKPTIDADGKKDWGNIFGLRIENGQFKFETDYSEICLTADELELIIK